MGNIKAITTDELEQKLKSGETIHLVDVREEEEVQEGMIPQAKHIPMGEIPEALDQFKQDEEYTFICRSGQRSMRVCQFMIDQGYTVCNVTGGMLNWKGEAIPKEDIQNNGI
ncbi:rhodanese-like domain-containing protein [Heyndrickxia ginsengihumi]|uniref:rhodanese-like domain-containing protein n=1 Tax=Heyndrickxia ginsengihumi TaxID=363870 RepID=UPI00046FE34F|nr:rhodanese-like domain-containing protein [Heyndrickxia ginsengihumi]